MGSRSHQAVVVGANNERIDLAMPLQQSSTLVAKREPKKGRGLVPRPQTRVRICLFISVGSTSSGPRARLSGQDLLQQGYPRPPLCGHAVG